MTRIDTGSPKGSRTAVFDLEASSPDDCRIQAACRTKPARREVPLECCAPDVGAMIGIGPVNDVGSMPVRSSTVSVEAQRLQSRRRLRECSRRSL